MNVDLGCLYLETPASQGVVREAIRGIYISSVSYCDS